MCENCKERIHPRFKVSETHTIVSIKDVAKKDSDICGQFGSLQVSQPVISSLLSAYTSNLVAFTKMQYSANDTIYCSYHVKDKGYNFCIIRLLRESMKVLQKLDIECTDFALSSKDEIYHGVVCGSELKCVSTDGVTNTVLSTSPMVIMCIHISENNKIILGLREQGSPFPVTGFSTRQIAVFDENKKHTLTIEYDQKGKNCLVIYGE
ncbi:unnamed protein product [Mytilus edulis]|uniref:Uncharacterized protein n=1 Tax=Mytilus edulis TaxID=6550 RepID=A0A8S3Q407_MYTED|nr:unnamed protein product [Mytilus edulis]